jgi:hypothetical protein
MRMIGLLCGVIVAAALSGCNTLSTMGSGTGSGTRPLTGFVCTYEVDCVVTVSVTGTGPCVITVDRPEIVMSGSANWTTVTHLIRWELDDAAVDAKFRFDPNIGVVLKAPDPDNQFSGQSLQGGGKQYHWRDKNTNYLPYDYAINIVQRGTALTCKLDPRVVNN